MPTLAIIMPTFNDGKNLKRFLKTYKMQRERADELIIVDNCSTDGTSKIIAAARKSIPELKFIRCKSTTSEARNIGIDAATTDYITFMDADWRFLHPLAIAEIKSYLHEGNYAFFSYMSDSTLKMLTAKMQPLRKAMFLHDEPYTMFPVIMRSSPIRFNTKLEYGEDRDYHNKFRNSWQEIKIYNNVSRSLGYMNVRRWLKRYRWYGRTLPKYIAETKDIHILLGCLLYIMIVPATIRGFWRGMRQLRHGLEMPLMFMTIETLKAIGIIQGLWNIKN